MAKPPSPPAPDLAELAAEVARLRERVEKLERAQGRKLVLLGPGTGSAKPIPAQRNSSLAERREAALRIEPDAPWEVRPPGLKGRGK